MAVTVPNNADWSTIYAAKAGSAPFDLTGCVIVMQLRASAGTEHVELEARSSAGTVVILNAALGAFALAVPALRMKRVQPRTYARDFLFLRGPATLGTLSDEVEIVPGVTVA